uniref:Apoptosis inducing factor mitochondria associated 5 n=1 Tax=Sphaeramia orbicularis TaxID=375764 RepID=A0A673BWW3_9TELE
MRLHCTVSLRMMEVEVGRHSVLLTRFEGKFNAFGNLCTHYGAPLSKGFISGQRVRCPWHGSCFNLITGDLEEYPGMDCLPCHKTIRQQKRLKHMGRAEPGVTHTILLLGGGAASLSCAETLRQENYNGRIIMVSRDDLLPYDKTRLSKVMNVESSSIMLRTKEFYQQYDIEVWLKKEALSVDTDMKTVTFDDGLVQKYDQLLISTGCRYERYTQILHTMLSDKNVKFYMNDNVTEVRHENGKCSEAILSSFSLLPGIIPNSEFLRGTKIQMDSKNFVPVDKHMQTNVPGVFCGGDLSTFPLAMAKDHRVNIGHWQMAQTHGRIAALNMLGKQTELNTVPFYWTVLLGKTVRYTGYGEGYTEIVMKGKPEEKKFLALYIKNDQVIAAVSLNFDPAVSAVAERLVTGKVITKKEAQYVLLSWL